MSEAQAGDVLGGVVPQLVALDIDGTVLGYDGALHPEVVRSVRAAREAGVHVILATGREVYATMPVLADLGIDVGWAVCSNGAVTVELDPREPEGFRVARSVTFDAARALGLLEEAFPDAVFAIERPGGHLLVSGPFPDGELYGRFEVAPMDELRRGPVSRLVVRAPQWSPEEFWPLVQQAGLHGVSFTVGYTAWLDIGPEGVSKASALEALRGQLGVDAEATAAVGDWRNDIEMLRWAARGVAMGQALPEILEAADARTATVEEAGVAVVLDAVVAAVGRMPGASTTGV